MLRVGEITQAELDEVISGGGEDRELAAAEAEAEAVLSGWRMRHRVSGRPSSAFCVSSDPAPLEAEGEAEGTPRAGRAV